MIQYKSNRRYKVKTPQGWQPFQGMRRTTKSKVLKINFEDGLTLKCSSDHRFIVDGKEVFASSLRVGSTLSNNISIIEIAVEDSKDYLYDLVEVGGGNVFIADNILSHNCNFSTSGATLLEPEIINWYEETFIREPLERRGIDNNLWIWGHPDYSRLYAVIADVARGDGKDYQAFHIIDIEDARQVGEYKGQLDTRDYGNFLISVATEYNDALLVIENTGIGWDVVQTAISRGYRNLYYSPRSDAAATDVEAYMARFDKGDGMVPGFTTSQRTRPLVIAKMKSYMQERSCTLQSRRLLDELRTFIWKNGKAQALEGYNDDLVMAWSIGLFLRDTTLRFQQTSQDLAKASLSSFGRSSNGYQVYQPHGTATENPWQIINPYGQAEDIRWVL